MELQHYGNFGLIGEELTRLIELQELHAKGQNLHGIRGHKRMPTEPEVVFDVPVRCVSTGQVIRKAIKGR